MTWKDQIAPKQIFSQKTTKKIFMYLLVTFLSRINKKKTEGRFKVKRIISITLLAHFIVQNCKIILTADPELWDRM